MINNTSLLYPLLNIQPFHRIRERFVYPLLVFKQSFSDFRYRLFTSINMASYCSSGFALYMNDQKRSTRLNDHVAHKTISANQDEEFLHRIRETIFSNMKKEGFGVQMLCKMVYMSRTQLHLKIKAATNRSTSHYIRFVRIEKACQLLRETDLYISQVAFEVGIDSFPYFSRIFRTEVGLSPHAYRKKCSLNSNMGLVTKTV